LQDNTPSLVSNQDGGYLEYKEPLDAKNKEAKAVNLLTTFLKLSSFGTVSPHLNSNNW
jgi:hypothetical protein